MYDQERVDRLNSFIVSDASVDQLEEACGGVNLNQADAHGCTPLMAAAACGSIAAVEVLLRNGASLSAAGYLGCTALHVAALHNKLRIVDQLLMAGADVNVSASDGTTPLICAAAWQNAEVVEFLLLKGADRWRKNDRGDTAAEAAREQGYDDLADFIEMYPAKESFE